MAEKVGDISNSDFQRLFEVLADWDAQLKAQNIDFEALSTDVEAHPANEVSP